MPQVDLTRTVRFFVDPTLSDEQLRARLNEKPHNSFAGFPPAADDGPGWFFEFDVRCRGEVDRDTGYFLNIKDIDSAFRRTLIVSVVQLCRGEPNDSEQGHRPPDGSRPVRIPTHERMPQLVRMLDEALLGARRASRPPAPSFATPGATNSDQPIIRGLTWRLSPFLRVEAQMNQAKDVRVFIRQQFDFCASHRLHAAGLSDEENRRIFGKCNLPSGHGHNYRVEPCVEVPVTPDAGRPGSGAVGGSGGGGVGFRLSDLERLTAETVIDRFDHKHLNIDTPEFDVARGGVNPSVENIAVVCFNLLEPRISALSVQGKAARLRSVTVWETEKTSATYPAL